jgi:hypothetical protein
MVETNLAATTAARKERLIALRKRKQAAEQGNGVDGPSVFDQPFNASLSLKPCRSHFAFKQRNFDPETRQLRNRERGEGGEDTVEAAVEGLAESILKEDEEKRKEELVRSRRSRIHPHTLSRGPRNITPDIIGPLQYPAETGELGLEAGHDE